MKTSGTTTFPLSFRLLDWSALMPGVVTQEEWGRWALDPRLKQESEPPPFPKLANIPMMTARRMSKGSRLAVEIGMEMLKRHEIKALVFSSRHGEIERTYQVIQRIMEGGDTSPTDFAMSVHNTASGLLTITAKAALPTSSVASGVDSFQQALFDVAAFFASGISPVLLVDFDGMVPELYRPLMQSHEAYAAAFLMAEGQDYRVSLENAEGPEADMPQSLEFLRNHLLMKESFVIEGEKRRWKWESDKK